MNKKLHQYYKFRNQKVQKKIRIYKKPQNKKYKSYNMKKIGIRSKLLINNNNRIKCINYLLYYFYFKV